MANMMALVSQSGFRDLEGEHGKLEVGVTRPIDAYHSKAKALAKLTGGGTLFLVTVREGALWILGALENPTHDGTSWRAAPNTTPITDASRLVDELKFDNGKGITAPPEKLAMSLQTPRVLADEDVLQFRALATPSPNAAYRAAVAGQGGTAMTGKPSAGGKKPSRAPTSPTAAPVAAALVAAASPAVVPTTWQQAVASVGAWGSLDDAARSGFVADVAASLGPAFTPLPHGRGVAQFGALQHASGTEFIIIPGGHLAMGFTADDVLAVMNVFEDDELEEYGDPGSCAGWFTSSRPTREVAVAPFIVARKPVEIANDDPLATLAADGLRLLSEAEWEWLGREGGAVDFVALPRDRHPLGPTISPAVNDEENGWGVSDMLNREEAVADCWHDNYDGAPTTSEPWEPSETGPWVMRMGHTWWQGAEEAVALHPACRSRLEKLSALRPARSLAAAPASGGVDWSATVSRTVEALMGRGAADRWRGAAAAKACSAVLGPDSAALAATLLNGLDGMPKARQQEVALCIPPDPDAVRAHADQVFELMRNTKPAIRAGATKLVAAMGSEDALVAVRRELGKERKHEVRAGLVGALDMLTDALDVEAPELGELRNHGDPLVSGAACLALMRRGNSDMDTLRAAARSAAAPRSPDLPWHNGDIGGAVRGVLAGVDEATRVLVARSLIDMMGSDLDIIRTVLELLFEKQKEIRRIEDLAPLQREAVEKLAALRGKIGRMEDHYSVRLAEHGIPRLRAMRRWLGLDPPTFAFAPHTWPVGDKMVTMPLWQWTAEIRELARAEQWPVARYTETVAQGVEGLNPLQRLELHFDQSEMRILLPYENGDKKGFFPQSQWLEPVLEAAAKFDLEAAKKLVERHLIEEPGWQSWAVTFFLDHNPEGTVLPPLYADAVPVLTTDKAFERHWAAIAPDQRQIKIEQYLHGAIANGCVAWSVIKELTALKEFWELTPPLAAGILAIGSMALKYSNAEAASPLVSASEDAEVQAVLAEWRSMGADRGESKATSKWKKRALQVLRD